MRPRRAWLAAILSAYIVAACTPQQAFSPQLTSSLPETPTPVAVQQAGGSSRLSAEQGLTVVIQAFVVLLDRYVDSVEPAALLRAAFEGFAAALPAGQPRAESPAFTGTNPAQDIAAFRRAYLDAATPAGGQEAQAKLAHAAVRRMAESLGDCHTVFTDPNQMREQLARASGELKYAGIGVRIKRQPNEPILVWELLDGGSAGKAGLKPGDIIVKVDGRDTTSMPLDQVANLIRGPEGSQVKLTIERPGASRPRDVTVKRVNVAEPAVQSKLLPGDIAYFRLNTFSKASQTELLQAIQVLESKNPKGWILDLRTNGGGELTAVLSTTSRFLKDGPFGFQVERNGQRAALGPDGTYLPRQHPLVVLVGDSTASGAELFAAAVQHHRGGKTVGTKTAGCLGIGSRYQLEDGSGLSVTTAKLLGPTGDDVNKIGFTPGEVVPISRADLAAGKDPQLQRALALLGAPTK
ncbi:MAG: S41 family peptidase [Chloroflexi bacterium]|nr:S41 family peptidase [Chloroflexota bacterium]